MIGETASALYATRDVLPKNLMAAIDKMPKACSPGTQIEGMGVYDVQIGERSFTCLRVIDVSHTISEENILMEGYLTREGRTVLCRRYNGRYWGRKIAAFATRLPWDEHLPDSNRIIIDDTVFVHWYDCLSDRACGLEVVLG